MLPDVSIVIVSWNTRELLLTSLASLHEAVAGCTADVWVVDNASCDGSADAVQAAFPAVNLIVNAGNKGFAAANNQAIRASRGRYLLLLNSDTVAEPGSIARLVEFADQHDRAAVVGPMLVDPDGTFQASYATFPSLFSEFLSVSGIGPRLLFRNYPSFGPTQSLNTRSVDYIPGACMLLRRPALDQIGVLDEQYFMYNEETDLCLRARRAGWQVWYLPAARIRHFGGQSTRQLRQAMVVALYRSKVRFFRKHHGPLAAMLLQALLVGVLRGKRWLQIFGRAVRSDRSVAPVIRWPDLGSTVDT